MIRKLIDFAALVVIATGAHANSNNPSAIAGKTNMTGGAGCAGGGCHGSAPDPAMGVAIAPILGHHGVEPGRTEFFSITASKSGLTNGTRLGFDIASNLPSAFSIHSCGAGRTRDPATNDLVTAAGCGALRTTTSGSANDSFGFTMPSGTPVGTSYTVYAVAALGTASYAHAANLTVTAAPSRPVSIAASNPQANSMHLDWGGGGPEYRLVYKLGSTMPNTAVDGIVAYEGPATSATVSGLAPNSYYSFRVFSKLSGQEVFSSWSGVPTTTSALTAGSGNVRHVNVNTGSDASNNCTAEASPCKTITHAMAQAAAGDPGDTVRVAPGGYNVYTGEVFPIVLKPGVTIYGWGGAENTTLDGIGDTVKQGLLVIDGNTSTRTRIEGLGFSRGLRVGPQGTTANGGAIRVTNATALVTITRNVFTRNEARGYRPDGTAGEAGGAARGGAVYIASSVAEVTNNFFIGNLARGGNGLDHPATPVTGGEVGGTAEGGAVYFDSNGLVSHNTFHLNRAAGGNGGYTSTGYGPGGNAIAGAASLTAGTADNNIFQRNIAEGGFGSVRGTASAGALLLTGATATRNQFHDNPRYGIAGAADSTGTSPLIAQTLFHATPTRLRTRPGSPTESQGAITPVALDFDLRPRSPSPSIGASQGGAVSGTPFSSPLIFSHNNSDYHGNGPQAGKDAPYRITLSNPHGPATPPGTFLWDVLTAGAAFVWAPPECNVAASIVACDVNMAAGEGQQIKVVVRAPVPGTTLLNNYLTLGGPIDATFGHTHSLANNVTAVPVANAILRYRLYNDTIKEHLFTTSLNEYNTLGANGWVQEGTVGKLLDNPGSFNGVIAVPYYRLYDSATNWHHWTTDANEYYTLMARPGWSDENVDGYILPAATGGATALYRLNYPFLGSLHHWTIDANEYNTLIADYGWIGEGGSGFVIQ